MYDKGKVVKWAELYKKCFSFNKVAKTFGVDNKTVKKYLTIYKNDMDLIFKDDLVDLGLKFCKSCGIAQSINNFGKNTHEKDATHYTCKICANLVSAEYRKNNPDVSRDTVRRSMKKRRENNLEVVREVGRNNEKKRRQRIKNHNIRRAINPYVDDSKMKKCYGHCKKTKYIVEFSRDISRKDGLADCCKECNTLYKSNLIKNNINYKLSHSLRNRLRWALKNNQKGGSAVRDLGCSIEELKYYLEQKFYVHLDTGEEMAWDNWSINGWHIDHIIPLTSFDLTNRKQFLKACHYTNLQPLWAQENLSKGASYEKVQPES